MENQLFTDIRCELMRLLENGKDWNDQEILEQIDELVLIHTRRTKMSVKEKENLRKEIFYSVRKLDILQELLDDDKVTEIMVNGYQNIFIEKFGKKMKWDKSFISK